MSLLAEFDAQSQRGERRSGTRRALRLSVGANLPGSPDLVVRVHDLSETGVLIETSEPLGDAEQFEVIMPLAGAIDATVVWHSGNFYGCEFNRAVPSAAISAALLRSEPRQPKAEAPRTPADLLSKLRDINASIEQVGHQLDDTIGQLKGGPPRPDDQNWVGRDDYSAPDVPQSDGADWVVIVTLILAGLAGLVLVAALLGSPLFP